MQWCSKFAEWQEAQEVQLSHQAVENLALKESEDKSIVERVCNCKTVKYSKSYKRKEYDTSMTPST